MKARIAYPTQWLPPCAALLAAAATSGCTQEEITPWGKLLFGFMVVALIVIPITFWLGWKKRLKG